MHILFRKQVLISYVLSLSPVTPGLQCADDNGTVFDEGDEMPDDDPCNTCNCYNAEKICETVQCDLPVCDLGYEIVNATDQCCPSCQKSNIAR